MKKLSMEVSQSLEFRTLVSEILLSMRDLRIIHHQIMLRLPIDEVVLEQFFEDSSSLETLAQKVILSENEDECLDDSNEFIDSVESWIMRAEYISMNLMHYQYNPEYEIKTPMPDDHQTSLAYLCKVYVQCSSLIERYTDEDADEDDVPQHEEYDEDVVDDEVVEDAVAENVSAPVEADKDKLFTQETISLGKDLVCILVMFSFAWYCIFQIMSSSP